MAKNIDYIGLAEMTPSELWSFRDSKLKELKKAEIHIEQIQKKRGALRSRMKKLEADLRKKESKAGEINQRIGQLKRRIEELKKIKEKVENLKCKKSVNDLRKNGEEDKKTNKG